MKTSNLLFFLSLVTGLELVSALGYDPRRFTTVVFTCTSDKPVGVCAKKMPEDPERGLSAGYVSKCF
jgi:hypothetical protein